MGMAVGLAAMAAEFFEDVATFLDEEAFELPTWILAECIRREGPGGRRLLDKCLRPRDNSVKGMTPSGMEFVNDQMAFLGAGPRIVLSNNPNVLVNHSNAVDMLLPRKSEMLDVLERRNVTMTRAAVKVFFVRDACHPDIVKALAESPNNEALGTEAAHAIIEQAWLGALMPYSIDCLLNAVYVAVLCMITLNLKHADTGGVLWIAICACITAKDVVEELLQLRQSIAENESKDWCGILRQICSYICTTEQFWDWGGIMADVLGMITVWSDGVASRMILAFWVGTRWMRCLYGLRGYERIGQKMLPILQALRDTVIFMLVVVFFLAAAVHAYYVLEVKDAHSNLYIAVLYMFRLALFGDFDLFELEGVDVTYERTGDTWQPRDPDPSQMYLPVHILFGTVGGCITITLMNLLIGILSSNYDRYEDQSVPIFLRARALMLVRYAARPWARSPWRVWSKRSLPNYTKRDGYLWVATRAEINLDEARSMRTVFREELRRAMNKDRRRGNEIWSNSHASATPQDVATLLLRTMSPMAN
jgi:hypothetical protein